MTICFIGGGNMATALITGLLQSPDLGGDLRVSDPSAEVRERLATLGVNTFEASPAAVAGADAVILAVKPQVMPRVFEDLAGKLAPGTLVVSVAAGITLRAIRDALGAHLAVIRSMPNTPALLGAGITGLYAHEACTPQHRELAEDIMAAVGETVWVAEETLIDVVTAISGSGPAYFYRMVEALRAAGESLGLPADTAAELARQTAYGAGVMALQGGADVAELRRRVTSPGGTTQAALEALSEGGFDALIAAAAEAAVRRGRELAGEGEAK